MSLWFVLTKGSPESGVQEGSPCERCLFCLCACVARLCPSWGMSTVTVKSFQRPYHLYSSSGCPSSWHYLCIFQLLFLKYCPLWTVLPNYDRIVLNAACWQVYWGLGFTQEQCCLWIQVWGISLACEEWQVSIELWSQNSNSEIFPTYQQGSDFPHTSRPEFNILVLFVFN